MTNVKSRGFTLIELLMVMSIISILATGILVGVRTVNRKGELDRSASGTIELLRTARERTLATLNDDQWGLHLTGSSVALFQGATYVSADDTFALPSGVTATWALTGGGDDVVFDRIEGTTALSGTITLTNTSGDDRVITVLDSGEIALIGVLPVELGTRVDDTRHAHLVLIYDLSTATTLELTFIDMPDVIESITIADFVSGSQFLWRETIDVNGDDETLRLVSHVLGPATTLSVRRDQADNGLPLEMRVDGILIASYTAGGTITPGSGVTVTVQ